MGIRPGKVAAAACCLALVGCGGTSDNGGHRLGASQQASLFASVRAARAAAGTGDRSRAIKALNSFRAEIARLERQGAIDPSRLRLMRRLAIQATRRVETELPAPAPVTTPAPAPTPPQTTTQAAPAQPAPAKPHPKKKEEKKKAQEKGKGGDKAKANGKGKNK